MPLYDCGAPECAECQRAFGPDRSKAIDNYHARARYYAELNAQRNSSQGESPAYPSGRKQDGGEESPSATSRTVSALPIQGNAADAAFDTANAGLTARRDGNLGGAA